jgi:hypothetical protein
MGEKGGGWRRRVKAGGKKVDPSKATMHPL